VKNTNSLCRWGILATADIARKNWLAIRNSGNGRVVAVASRQRDKAELFICDCQAEAPFVLRPEACGSYDELLARDDVDAVYIPLPTGLRKEWVLKAAAAGKHVLAEKPAGLDAAEVAEMIAACAEHGVQFMDGVMFMHSRRLSSLRQTLDQGGIGRLRRVTAHFSFTAPEDFGANIRSSTELEPAGCAGDLGWYALRFILWAMNYQPPTRVSARVLARIHGVPAEFSGEVFFAEGVSASFYCSFRNHHQQWAVLSGDQGYIRIPDFVVPYVGNEVGYEISQAVFSPRGCDHAMENHSRLVSLPEYGHGHPSAQESHLFRSFGDIVFSGRLEPHWGAITLLTQQVLDTCLASARDKGSVVDFTPRVPAFA
jgi:predicted dehydrogenase